jgi:hypothetical protein
LSFRGLLRPGQGFQRFYVLRREGGISGSGRAHNGSYTDHGEFFGILTNADPREIDRYKQLGTPITHTIVQRGTKNRAKATDILELRSSTNGQENTSRKFIVHGEPRNPGDLGHFLIYQVEERADL